MLGIGKSEIDEQLIIVEGTYHDNTSEMYFIGSEACIPKGAKELTDATKYSFKLFALTDGLNVSRVSKPTGKSIKIGSGYTIARHGSFPGEIVFIERPRTIITEDGRIFTEPTAPSIDENYLKQIESEIPNIFKVFKKIKERKWYERLLS